MRILIIENDVKLNSILATVLKEHGYQNDVVETLEDAIYYLDIRNYDLILMNGMLADEHSIDIFGEIENINPKTVIIVISARDDIKSEIEALRSGADDYIRKPFDLDVLVARIQARLRSNKIIEINELTINPDEAVATYKELKLDLNGKPLEVLIYLAQHRDQIISKEQILHALWEEPELVTPNVIDVAIQRIRQKIDMRFGITTIETVRRRGFRFIFPKETDGT